MSLTTTLCTKNSSLLLHFCLYFSYLFFKYSQIKYKTFYNLIMSHFSGSIFMLSGLSQPPRCPSYYYSSSLKEKMLCICSPCMKEHLWAGSPRWSCSPNGTQTPWRYKPACPSLCCLCISCPWTKGRALSFTQLHGNICRFCFTVSEFYFCGKKESILTVQLKYFRDA